MNTYKVGAGPFLAPPLPQGLLPETGGAKEADEALRGIQQTWGTVGIAVTKSLAMIEEVVRSFRTNAASGPSVSSQDVMTLTRKLSEEAVRPLSHVLRISASKFNSHQARRKDKAQAAIKRHDHTLGQAVLATPLSTSAFFAEDLTPQIREAQNRRSTRDMLREVSRGSARQAPYPRPQGSQRPQASATQASAARGRAPQAAQSRGYQGNQASRPFRGGRPSQGQQGGRRFNAAAGRGSSRGRGATRD